MSTLRVDNITSYIASAITIDVDLNIIGNISALNFSGTSGTSGSSGTSGTSGTSGGGGATEVTYLELVSLITGGTLTTGSYYLITDFQTCYDQPDYDYNRNPIITSGNSKTAEIDPIIVFATSSTTLSENAYQPSYPNDSIKYDISFTVTERTGSPAKGRITERIDEFNNRTDYDHRTILFKRYRYYEIAFDSPYQGTVEVSVASSTEMVVYGTGTNFLSISLGTKVGFDTNNNDYRVYEITNVVSDTEMTITGLTNTILSSGTKMFFADWDEYSSYYQNNVDDPTLLFEEYYTFNGDDDYNNYIGNHANLYQWNENDFILANNVFHTRFIGNKFGDECFNNTFFDDCENNTVGNYFYNNITDDDFDGNVIGNYFYNNKITANFQYNRIGENFYGNYIVQNDFYRNNIMNDFRYNEISGDDFQNNEIGNQFNYNKLRNGQFYKNDIGNGFNDNNIYWNFYGNLIGNGYYNNDIYCPFYDNVIGDYFQDNNFGDINDPSNNEFYENKIGYNFYGNNITGQTNNNVIGNDFDNNTITADVSYNVIGENFSNNTISSNFFSNQIFNEFKGNLITDNGNFELNKIGFGFAGNQLSGYCGGNVFGDVVIDNDFLGDVVSNTTSNWFSNNIIGDEFLNNKIGNYFQNNIIGIEFQHNNIGSNFESNTIDDGFGFGGGDWQGNVIGNNFSQNTIGEYFYNNTIPDNFYSNIIGEYFQWNIINTNVDNIDFTINYGNITGFTYSYLGTSAVDGIYYNLTGSTNGNGSNATFNVVVTGNIVTDVTLLLSGKLYLCGNTITILGTEIGGVTGVINTFTSDAVGKSGTTGVYISVPATGGTGTGASFIVTVVSDLVSDLTMNGDGEGYSNGDQLTVLGSLFGGVDGVDDITINITSVYSDDIVISVGQVSPIPPIYRQYTKQIFKRADGQKRLSYYDENDVLTIEPIVPVDSFTITSSDFTNGNPIYLNTNVLGVNGTEGFENTSPETDLYTGYYGIGLTTQVRNQIGNIYNSLGLNLGNSTGYVWQVTWGPGSSISTGLIKLGVNVNSGFFDIQTIDPADTDWQLPGSSNGTSLVGTFKFPATFTPYLPLINKGGWC